MNDAQIAANATINSAIIAAVASIIVAIIGLGGIFYQTSKKKSQKKTPSTIVNQKACGRNNTVIGIQNNNFVKENHRGKRK